jgi:hypothetical protein
MAAASQGVARVQLIWLADANIHPEILGRRRDSGPLCSKWLHFGIGME